MNISVFGRNFLFVVLILGLISCGKNSPDSTQEDDWAPRPPQIVRKKAMPTDNSTTLSTQDTISFADPESQRGLKNILFEYACLSKNSALIKSSVSLPAAQNYKVINTMDIRLLPLDPFLNEQDPFTQLCNLKIIMHNQLGSTRTFFLEKQKLTFEEAETHLSVTKNGTPIVINQLLNLSELYAVDLNFSSKDISTPRLVCQHFTSVSRPDPNGAYKLSEFLSDAAVIRDDSGRNRSHDAHTQFCRLIGTKKDGDFALSKQFAIRFFEPHFTAKFTSYVYSYLKGSTLSIPEVMRTDYSNQTGVIETIRVPRSTITGKLTMYSGSKVDWSQPRVISQYFNTNPSETWEKDGYRYFNLLPGQHLQIIYTFEGSMACFAPGLVEGIGVTIDNLDHLKVEKALFPILRDQESNFIKILISSDGSFNGKSTSHESYSHFYIDIKSGYAPPTTIARAPECWVN